MTMMLQSNQLGAWRNVARFEAGDESRVRQGAAFLAPIVRCKFRLLDDDGSVLAHCDATGRWEEWRNPS